MQKVFAGLIVVLLFCVFTGVAYLRLPPQTQTAVTHPLGPRAMKKSFAGQRHSGIDVSATNSGTASPAIAQVEPIRADPGNR